MPPAPRTSSKPTRAVYQISVTSAKRNPRDSAREISRIAVAPIRQFRSSSRERRPSSRRRCRSSTDVSDSEGQTPMVGLKWWGCKNAQAAPPSSDAIRRPFLCAFGSVSSSHSFHTRTLYQNPTHPTPYLKPASFTRAHRKSDCICARLYSCSMGSRIVFRPSVRAANSSGVGSVATRCRIARSTFR